MMADLTTRYSVDVDRDEIIRVFRTFEAAGLEYVLIGAAAAALRALLGHRTEEIPAWRLQVPHIEEAQRAREEYALLKK